LRGIGESLLTGEMLDAEVFRGTIRENSLRSLIKGWEKNYELSFKTPERNLPRSQLSLFPQGRPPYQSGQLSFIGKITNALTIVFQRQQKQQNLLHAGLRNDHGWPLELILL